MTDGDCGTIVHIFGNKVIACAEPGSVCDVPIYSFKLNGTGRKKIADGLLLKPKGKIIYYKYKIETINGELKEKYKVYSCLSTGKNKKALTGWVRKILKKYNKYWLD